MKHFFNTRVFTLVMTLLFLFAVVAMSLRPAPTASGAQTEPTYVLTAPEWGPAQDAAVSKAGGDVTFSHRQGGFGLVTSSAPDFLDRVSASNEFTNAAMDQVV